MNAFRMRCFVLGGIFLTGCQGAVLEPSKHNDGGDVSNGGAPAIAGKKGAGPASKAGNGSGGSGKPSEPDSIPGSGATAVAGNGSVVGGPPAPVGALFSRLTRAEYRATVKEALGVDIDVSTIPVDGRVGPYTSNTQGSADAVHPYLLIAEELAAAVIPSKLAACEGSSTATCVRNDYRAPLERLYRRPLADAEVTSAAKLVTDLAARGVPAVEATRALLIAALTGPDFLFHSLPGASDGAAHGRRLAERLSYALWDAAPDTLLMMASAGSAGELGARLVAQSARLTGDLRTVPVLARFLAQWLHVDTDLRLEDPSFEWSPRFQELIALVQDALQNDTSIMALISGDRGFVHRDNLAAYGLDSFSGGSDTDVTVVSWSGNATRRGILSEELFADATRHPDKSRRAIFRGRLVRHSLLCDTIPAPPAALVAISAEVTDRTTDTRCASCHLRMDPIGKAFAGLDPDETAGATPGEILAHDELEGLYTDLPALLTAVAQSRSFAECFAKNWLGFFLEQPVTSADVAWVAQIADAVQAGATLEDIIEHSILNLEASSETIPQACGGS